MLSEVFVACKQEHKTGDNSGYVTALEALHWTSSMQTRTTWHLSAKPHGSSLSWNSVTFTI